MGRTPCCDKNKVKRGPWSPDEDAALVNYLQNHGTGGNWISLPQRAGLKRCGKSCRLRWLNYLRPDIKHGCFTDEEDTMILSLYNTLGSRWSVIASKLAGRTDNDVKNRWNTKLKKKFVAAANDSHQQLQSNYHHFSTSTSVVIDHHHRLSIQFPALNLPNFEEYYKPEFSDNSLTQNPPTTTVLTSSINNQGSLMSNVDSETSSSVLVAAAENNDYHDVLWSGPNYSCGSCCGTSSKIDHGFYGMDFVGGNCGEFTGGFWADHQDQSTGLEDVLFS